MSERIQPMSTDQWKDPIVEEVRAARAEIFKEADNDLHKLCELLRKAEQEHKDKLVMGKPRYLTQRAPKPKE